ncbi:MAG: ABC transporter ATP-binding protein [Chloroflexi bacterium]|nr:ABC transporter ATP-binding protein [Chloroflexota bacterium]
MRLRAEDLAVSFHGPSGDLLPALGPISFLVEDDQFVCLLGPSGCGKSTLIRVLAGLLKPSAGAAYCDDLVIQRPLTDAAIMFQDTNLMPWRTVLDNIALPLEIAGVPRSERYRTVRKLLPQLNLESFESAYPAELSGGMAQRVALGRVILQEPQVWLLDEPFAALDALTRESLRLEFLRLRRRARQTIILVTHDINEAVLLADRVIVMSRRPGTLVADIMIDLPRPRSAEMIYKGEFLQLTREVRGYIEDQRG